MSFINRGVLQRQREASRPEPTPKTATPPSIAHPYRSLPPGKQWRAHDGKQAQARRRRQMQRQREKAAKKEFGSTAVQGVMVDFGPGVPVELHGALLLDFNTKE